MDPKQVIVMRTDTTPKMRKGKMIAQGAHASLGVIFNYMSPEWGLFTVKNGDKYKYQLWLPEGEVGENMRKWIEGSFVKIVVGGTLSEVVESYEKAKVAGIPCSLIEDKGLTEFGGEITITCCGIGPDDPEKIDKITGHLSLL